MSEYISKGIEIKVTWDAAPERDDSILITYDIDDNLRIFKGEIADEDARVALETVAILAADLQRTLEARIVATEAAV